MPIPTFRDGIFRQLFLRLVGCASGHGLCVSGLVNAAYLKARAALPGSGAAEPAGAFIDEGRCPD